MYLIRRSDDDSLVKIKDTELATDLANEGDLVPFYKAGIESTGYIIFHYANRAELKKKLLQLQAESSASKEREVQSPKATPNLKSSKRIRKPKIIFTPASGKKSSKVKSAKLNQATKVKGSNAGKLSIKKRSSSSSSSRTESSTDEDKSNLENISQPKAKKLCFKPRHAESNVLKRKTIEKTISSESEDVVDEDGFSVTTVKHAAQRKRSESIGRSSQILRGTNINLTARKTGPATRVPKDAINEDEGDFLDTAVKHAGQDKRFESMGRNSQILRGTSINLTARKTGPATSTPKDTISEDEMDIFDNTEHEDFWKDRPALSLGRASPCYDNGMNSVTKKGKIVPPSKPEDLYSDGESVMMGRENDVEIPVDVTDDEDSNQDKQLFGQNWDNGKMKKLKGSIYIRQLIWNRIKCQRNLTPNRLLRNMIEGIFNPEYILNCTLTGKKPTNKGDLAKDVQPLHPSAVKVMFEIIEQKAKERGWPLPLDMKDLYRTATQRIGELKRDYTNRRTTQ